MVFIERMHVTCHYQYISCKCNHVVESSVANVMESYPPFLIIPSFNPGTADGGDE